ASYAQRRLWFLHSLLEQRSVYNIPFAIQIQGEINIDLLRQSFSQLIERHESLRTVFAEVDGQVMQVIQDTYPDPLTVVDSRFDTAAEQTAQIQIEREIKTDFDLEKGPLLRACLYQLDIDHWLLFV